MRLTLLRAKEALAKKAPADELEFRLNRAVERLLLNGKFSGSMQNIALTAPYGQVALPQMYRTIEGVKVDGIVAPVANQWYQYMPGKSDFCGCGLELVRDLGDGHALMRDLPLLGTLKLTYTSGTPQVLTIYGTDADGLPTTIVITGAVPVTNPFATVTRVHKALIPVDAPVGVKLVHTDVDSNETTLCLIMPFQEETFYRRYAIDTRSSVEDLTILAICKRRHVEFTQDQDTLPFSNISALSLALDGLQMESENDVNLSRSYFSDAVGLLNAELADTNAKTDLPPFRIVHAPGGRPKFRSHY